MSAPGAVLSAGAGPDVAGIIAASIAADGIYDKRLYKDPVTGEPVPYERDIPFYAGQRRLVLG